mgnify:CR=1 FL=1
MITIELSKLEARLCRNAAKLAESYLLPTAGRVQMSRGDWHDMSRWLTWLAVDFERAMDLKDRKAADRLSERIEAVIARYDVANQPQRPEPAKDRAKQLVMF